MTLRDKMDRMVYLREKAKVISLGFIATGVVLILTGLILLNSARISDNAHAVERQQKSDQLLADSLQRLLIEIRDENNRSHGAQTKFIICVAQAIGVKTSSVNDPVTYSDCEVSAQQQFDQSVQNSGGTPMQPQAKTQPNPQPGPKPTPQECTLKVAGICL